jgi:hypothetical protein
VLTTFIEWLRESESARIMQNAGQSFWNPNSRHTIERRTAVKNFRRYLPGPPLICMLFGLILSVTQPAAPASAQTTNRDNVRAKIRELENDEKELNDLIPASLAGSWNGGDWGEVTITEDGGSYSGTYSDTFGCGKGSFSFGKTGERTYEGAWHDPDGQHHGTFTLTASADGKSLDLSWNATDGRDLKNQSSSWTRR